MMPGSVSCPHCGTKLQYKTPAPPVHGRCSKCAGTFKVSTLPEQVGSPSEIQTSSPGGALPHEKKACARHSRKYSGCLMLLVEGLVFLAGLVVATVFLWRVGVIPLLLHVLGQVCKFLLGVLLLIVMFAPDIVGFMLGAVFSLPYVVLILLLLLFLFSRLMKSR